MLKVDSIEVRYGVIPAVKNLSIEVNAGEIVTLIGANGAGKSTTLKTISGLVHPYSGQISFEGQLISGLPAHEIVALGISQIPEGRGIFPNLTVKENLKLGSLTRKDKSTLAAATSMVFERFPVLADRQLQIAGTLSGGEQQMLAIGRALIANPRLLLMDEPSMGLAPKLVQEIFRIIKEINEQGTTIILVEQNANMALSVAHRAYVLETGEISVSGHAKDLLNNTDIQKAYLGY